MPNMCLALQRAAEFDEFYEQNFARVYNFVYYHVMDYNDADDLTAEVFFRAYTHYDSYDIKRAKPYTWLCAIARNAISDFKRKNARIVVVDWETQEECHDASVDIEGGYIGKEEQEALLRAMHTLPLQHQELLLKKYFLGMTNREISKEMCLSESNVGTKLSRIIADLKKKLLT